MRAASAAPVLRALCLTSVLALVVLQGVCGGANAGQGKAAAGPVKMKVFVSIQPQACFVERVGGGLVDVDVLVGPGRSPHTYEPTPRQMVALSKAQVYFTIGVPLEKAIIPKVERMNPRLVIGDTTRGITFLPLMGGDEGHGRDHAVGEPDPHVWLDPKRVRIMAGTICEVLSTVDPVHRDVYRRNLGSFTADLDRLDAELKDVFMPLTGKRVYVYHGAFGYLADAYGFIQVPVETGSREPSARDLARIIDMARSDGVRVIFVQPQFSRKKAEVIASQIGGVVVAIDPLPRDYMKEMGRIAKTMRDALARQR